MVFILAEGSLSGCPLEPRTGVFAAACAARDSGGTITEIEWIGLFHGCSHPADDRIPIRPTRLLVKTGAVVPLLGVVALVFCHLVLIERDIEARAG